ncbi:MAG: putative oxidoreductase [Acidimicrobiales bacterium]|nr:putative oxidoreductase [Acidimicrobiales bacterium]
MIGAGPGGTAAAITLAESGQRVTLVDKSTFPRDKICGDGLTTGALRLLEQLGLDPATVASWTEVDDAIVVSPSGRATHFPLPRGQGAYAVTARRMDLDAALLDRARAVGAEVIEGQAVTGAEDRPDGVVITLADGRNLQAAYAIGADGMWSPSRKLLGTATPGYLGEWHAVRQYFGNVGPRAATELWVWFEPELLPSYAWSFPLPDGRANVGFGIHRGGNVAVRDMKALWSDLLERPAIRAVLGADAEPEEPPRTWPIPARVDAMTLSAGRVLWVGDAAAACDPMTGEGIGQALLTGIRAAEAVVAAGPDDPAAARRRYELAVRRELVADHRTSVLLIRALRHRKGTRTALRLAGATPASRRLFARWLFEDEPRAILATPHRWHRSLFSRDGARLPPHP